MSGSAVAEMRSRALADPATSVLLVDAELRIRMCSEGASGELGAEPLVGAPLLDVLEAGAGADRLERAAERARAGTETRVDTRMPAGTRTLRFVPLSGATDGAEPLTLIAISEPHADGAEIEELRSRASDLETLATAARALARSSYPVEARRTICEAAIDVAGADVVALVELNADGHGLVVAAASGADIEGRTIDMDRTDHAARAFATGRAEFTPGIGGENSASAWPLGVGSRRGVLAPGSPLDRDPVPSSRWAGAGPAASGQPDDGLDGAPRRQAAVAIDHRAAALEQLTEMARTDPLTELCNRRAWQDELSRELARSERSGQPLAVGLLDLDELKATTTAGAMPPETEGAADRGRALAPPAASHRRARSDRWRRVRRDHARLHPRGRPRSPTSSGPLPDGSRARSVSPSGAVRSRRREPSVAPTRRSTPPRTPVETRPSRCPHPRGRRTGRPLPSS